jgi:phosphoribosylglycinamide formyltransferase-1
MSFKIAVLASTRGTDLQAIIDEMKAGKMPGIELAIVISNKKDCYALQRAREQGYKTLFIDPATAEQHSPEGNFDTQLIAALDNEKIDLIVLVGYMKILSSQFVRHFKNRIINIHPALLPKFGGKNFYGKSVHEAVLAAGERETGMTIHYVDEGVDTGKIILQKKITIDPADTAETLKEKVQNLEKKYYPEVIRQLAQNYQS